MCTCWVEKLHNFKTQENYLCGEKTFVLLHAKCDIMTDVDKNFIVLL